MSGLDPLAAFALQAVANAQAALEESTLNLGTLLADFQAKISVGDVLSATVLPPQNGVDRISLLGQPVVAQLPPGIHPGETLALQVTGFTNTAVIVRNLGTVDPGAPLPQAEPPALPPEAPQTAILRNVPLETTPLTPPPPRPIQPPLSTPAPPPRVAPPRELFVAASVRPTQAPQTPQASAPQTPVAQAQLSDPTDAAPGLEARIIATRASTTIGNPASVPLKAQPVTPKGAAPVVTPAQAAAAKTTAQAAAAHAAVTRATVERALVASASRTSVPGVPPPPPLARTAESALLTRLRVPITATTLAAARLVDNATRSATTAFEKLDTLLEKSPPDPRTATLRSTLAFVAKFDLRNVRALPEQIASYISNVVSGSESKVAQIVRALTESVVEQPLSQPPPGPQTAPAPLGVESRTAPEQAQNAPTVTPLHANVLARAAERSVALEHDIKAALLQLVADPPRGSSTQLIGALREALTATTAVQLNALTPQNNNANTITIPLPAYFYEGGQPAQLQISRDAPQSKNAMDGDNFHIAFILDTKSLGTVAIDVQTVGRNVSVDVKTETPRSADRFRTSLDDLRTRLQGLHYQVAAMAAGLASRESAKAAETASQRDVLERTSNVDMQA